MKKLLTVCAISAALGASSVALAANNSLSSKALQKHVAEKTQVMFDRMNMDAGRVQEYIKENAQLPKSATIGFSNDTFQTYNYKVRGNKNAYAVVTKVNDGPLKNVRIMIQFKAKSIVKLYDTTSYKCYTNVDAVVAGETASAGNKKVSALLPQCTFVSLPSFNRMVF